MQWACTLLYCHLWSLSLYHVFPRYLIIGTIWGEGREESKDIELAVCILIFYTTFACNSSPSKKNSVKCYHKRIYAFKLRTSYSCQILMKQDLRKKKSNITFNENLRHVNYFCYVASGCFTWRFTDCHNFSIKLTYISFF